MFGPLPFFIFFFALIIAYLMPAILIVKSKVKIIKRVIGAVISLGILPVGTIALDSVKFYPPPECFTYKTLETYHVNNGLILVILLIVITWGFYYMYKKLTAPNQSK